jgi:hypothetical protein
MSGGMDTHQIKAEVDKNLEKLSAMRDEVKLKIHLASLDAKKEWDEKLAPKVRDMESSAKTMTDQSRSALNELVAKMEQFLVRLRKDGKDRPPHSTH